MTMKSLLLGAAAGIAAIGAAQAADLPMTKGEAVEYVKVCTSFGPGFFYIPGTDTCLKIGGEIRADYRVFGGDRPSFLGSSSFSRDDNRSGFNTEARIWFDARTQTDWGLLRSYFQIDADSHPLSAGGRSNAYNGNTFTIDKAFIQFGGLTAGYAHSFFGFYDNEYGDTIWGPYYAESNTSNLIAYTAQFGGGFNATLSIEDARDHNQNGFAGIDTTAPVVPAAGEFVAFNQGGTTVPDVVAQLRWDQDWGTLAVQAAGHEQRSGVINPNVTFINGTGERNSNKYGFAVGGDVLIKIPAIDGGHFIVEGQYADGATDYLGVGNSVLGSVDNFYNPFLGNVERGKGWSAVAELGGNITPQWNANLVASYLDVRYDNALVNAAGTGTVDYGIKEGSIVGNLTYTVVKGLTIAGEVAYTRVEQHNGDFVTAPAPGVFKDEKDNVWQAGIRIKRVF
ncbi:polymerase [Labrys miyagiensis]